MVSGANPGQLTPLARFADLFRNLPRRERWHNWALASWALLKRTPAPVFAMAVLGVGLSTASGVLVKGIRNANDTITVTVTVTGDSTERITSDDVDWSVEVSHSGASQQASDQGVQPAVETTMAFLEAVKPERYVQRDHRSGEVQSISWTTTQSIEIGSWDVNKIATISRRIGQLIGEGVPLTINQPAYTHTKLADKRADMPAPFQITPPNSTEANDMGSYDTSTIEKDMTAVMAVTFRVNN